ncbi:Na+/H+ antiporter subunit E [Pseudonocardia nematodicida]|uniref:Na+/H+ antiporter subunit E n=1 Tax=Pseudonocardia nematodicida TaxID=1206997 RepID=A0ABV1KGP2_9PSEU
MSAMLTRPVRLVAFWCWFAGQIISSARDVLADILTPGSSATPRVVRLPLDCETGSRSAIMGALITLTPGTLTLGVVDGHRELLVHSMYHRDEESALADLRDMESRMLRAFGPRTREDLA